MSDVTKIQWTTHSFNPWWGCARVSPGCRFCYADDLAKRYGHQVWRRKGERRELSDQNWRKPLRWNRDAEAAGVPARVFCASMADVFEDHPQLPPLRERLWELIDQTPWLHWQLLTKRPQNVQAMAPWGDNWPETVWLGTSVEDQTRADERIPVLLDIPARTRFLSCEPLLGPVDLVGKLDKYGHRPRLTYWLNGRPAWGDEYPEPSSPAGLLVQDLVTGPSISWVIVGGESGPKARPMAEEWARNLVQQCAAAGVATFVKQAGTVLAKSWGCADRKGGDPLEWPADLQVREFPGRAA